MHTEKLILLCSMLVVSGCASSDNCRVPACPSCPINAPFECRETERKPFTPDLSLLKPLDPVAAARLCSLPEQDVQCQAANQSTLGNLLSRQSQLPTQTSGLMGRQQSCSIATDLLALQAAHQRNNDAAAALELFLRLVIAEGGRDNLTAQLQQLDATLRDIDELQQRGVLSPVSRSEVERQRLELLHRSAEVEATITQMNHQLAGMLKLELLPDARFWPEVNLTVDPSMPDPEEAVMTALGNRADLAALRLAANATGDDQDAAANILLQQLSPGLASAACAPCLGLHLRCSNGGCESIVRSEQLWLALADRENSVRSETLQAVAWLRARLEQITHTRRRLELARQSIESLEQQQRIAGGGPFNVRKARMDLLLIEHTLLQDVIEWKVAVVRLKQAQGLLAIECGYDLASHYNACQAIATQSEAY